MKALLIEGLTALNLLMVGLGLMSQVPGRSPTSKPDSVTVPRVTVEMVKEKTTEVPLTENMKKFDSSLVKGAKIQTELVKESKRLPVAVRVLRAIVRRKHVSDIVDTIQLREIQEMTISIPPITIDTVVSATCLCPIKKRKKHDF